MHKQLLLALGLVAATSATAFAGTIGSDSFSASVSFDGNLLGSNTATAQSVAGDCDAFSETGCDNVLLSSQSQFVGVDFVDGDTFDVGISEGGNNLFETFSIDIVLTGLDFMIGGAAAAITDVSFDIGGRGFSGFLEDPIDNPTGDALFSDPIITFTSNSISINLPTYSGQLLADAASLRFDVSLSAVPVSTVPLPAGLPLLVAGLGALGLARRRKKQ